MQASTHTHAHTDIAKQFFSVFRDSDDTKDVTQKSYSSESDIMTIIHVFISQHAFIQLTLLS